MKENILKVLIIVNKFIDKAVEKSELDGDGVIFAGLFMAAVGLGIELATGFRRGDELFAVGVIVIFCGSVLKKLDRITPVLIAQRSKRYEVKHTVQPIDYKPVDAVKKKK